MQATIEKILSANDAGETGGHQAGLLIPKDVLTLQFFPKLDISSKNPRCVLDLRDAEGEEWTFTFIYYNNRKFGGTRNEYRLTCMTRFMRRHSLKRGDSIIFKQASGRFYNIDYRRKSQHITILDNGSKRLKLRGSWTIIETNRLT